MPALLVVALVTVPFVELYVLLQVGQVLGVLPTVVLLVVMSLLAPTCCAGRGRAPGARSAPPWARAGCRPGRSRTARW